MERVLQRRGGEEGKISKKKTVISLLKPPLGAVNPSRTKYSAAINREEEKETSPGKKEQHIVLAERFPKGFVDRGKKTSTSFKRGEAPNVKKKIRKQGSLRQRGGKESSCPSRTNKRGISFSLSH